MTDRLLLGSDDALLQSSPLGLCSSGLMPSIDRIVQGTAITVSIVAAATLYVLVHESRRKSKKERKAGGEEAAPGGIVRDRLIQILTESADAAYQLIEQA